MSDSASVAVVKNPPLSSSAKRSIRSSRPARPGEPGDVVDLGQREQRLEQRRVVLGVGEQVRAAALPGSQQATVGPAQPGDEELRVRRAAAIQSSRSNTNAASASAPRNSAFQPRRTLSSSPGRTRRARFEQPGQGALDGRRPLLVAVHDVEDVATESRVRILEVALLGDAVEAHHLVGVVTTHLAELVDRPAVELALDALRVGVLGREEAALGVAEVAQHVGDDLLGDAPVTRLAGDLPSVHVGAQQQRLVVEHLLEVRHQPVSVDRVAVEAASHLVVHAAGRHRVQRHGDGVERGGGGRARVTTAGR